MIQSVEPYVSSEDIDKGTRWSADISKELEDADFGILCVVPGNSTEPWLVFEPGALSKSVDRSRVAPFLFRVKQSELSGPIVQFQSSMFEKSEVRKLLRSVNNAQDTDALDDTRLDQVFDVWWPHLEDELNQIEIEPAKPAHEPTSDSSRGEIREELLELAR